MKFVLLIYGANVITAVTSINTDSGSLPALRSDVSALQTRFQESTHAQAEMAESFAASIARLEAMVADQGRALEQCGCSRHGDDFAKSQVPPDVPDEPQQQRGFQAPAKTGTRKMDASATTTITSRSVVSETVRVMGDIYVEGSFYWRGFPVG